MSNLTFWYPHPILELEQRYGSLPFGMYPNAICHGVTEVSAKKMLDWAAPRYNTIRMFKMVQWCAENCEDHMTYSNKYGSFHFKSEKDRALFRLFHSDETMPPPEIQYPTHPKVCPF